MWNSTTKGKAPAKSTTKHKAPATPAANPVVGTKPTDTSINQAAAQTKPKENEAPKAKPVKPDPVPTAADKLLTNLKASGSGNAKINAAQDYLDENPKTTPAELVEAMIEAKKWPDGTVVKARELIAGPNNNPKRKA